MSEVKSNRNIFWSKVIGIMIALAMIVPVGMISVGATQPDTIPGDYIHVNESNISANIDLVDMRAPPYYRLAFTEPKSNQIEISLSNVGEKKEIVSVDLYAVEPDGVTESFLTTVHFGAIRSSQTKTKLAFDLDEEMWTPTQTGRNWIRGEIYVKGQGYEKILVNDFKESFNVVPGWRPVMHIEGDWVVDEPTTILNRTIVVDGDVYVNADLYLDYGSLVAANLTVTATQTVGAMQDIDIAASSDGQYKVEVKSTGTLNIYGKLWNNPQTKHYWFYMNGTLNLSRFPSDEPTAGIVENTFGPSDLSQPGGIICTTDDVTIENGATIRNGSSHGIYLQRSNAVIRSANIINNGGYGIYVNQSYPVINNTDLKGNGINILIKDWINPVGRPEHVGGVDTGYFIWHDNATGEWNVKWSAAGQHHFTGSVVYGSTTWPIDRTINNTEEGITFLAGTAIFDLYIDGASALPYIFVGQKFITPTTNNFRLSVAQGMVVSNNLTGGNPAAKIYNSSLSFDSNEVVGNNRGLYFYHSNVVIKGNNITENMGPGTVPGVPVTPNTGVDGYSSTLTIEDNYMAMNFGSVALHDDSHGVIRNNTIIEEGQYEYPGAEAVSRGFGIKVENSSAIIDNNSIFDCTPGINLIWASDVLISWNTIEAVEAQYAQFYNQRGELVGINITGFTNATISNNTIRWRALGIHLHGAIGDIILDYNTIENGLSTNEPVPLWGYGIYSESSFGTISNSTIENHPKAGIYCENSPLTIRDNPSISNNSVGIYLNSSSGSTIANNTVLNNSNGISLYSSPSNTLAYNEIFSSHDYGIYIDNAGNYTDAIFLLNNAVNGTLAGPGIMVENARVNISGCEVRENRGSGIVMENSKGEIAHNAIFRNHKPEPYQPPEGPFTGVEVLNSSGLWIHNNNVSWNYFNIDLVNSSNVLIEWNTIVDESAVTLEYPPRMPPSRGVRSRDSEITLANNTFYGCIYSAEILNANETTKIANNTFLPLDGSQLFHEAGIYLVNASVLIQGNTFDGIGGIGIWCTYGSNAYIESNTIVNGNSTGIYCNWSSPTIVGNTISGNAGWGILCEYAAPANAGVNGTQLMADNPNLGDNNLGRLTQYWTLQVRVVWTANGSGVSGQFVRIWDDTGGAPVWEGYTNAEGYAEVIAVPQYYVPNGSTTPTVLIPYRILADSSLEKCYVTDNTLYIYYL